MSTEPLLIEVANPCDEALVVSGTVGLRSQVIINQLRRVLTIVVHDDDSQGFGLIVWFIRCAPKWNPSKNLRRVSDNLLHVELGSYQTFGDCVRVLVSRRTFDYDSCTSNAILPMVVHVVAVGDHITIPIPTSLAMGGHDGFVLDSGSNDAGWIT